MIKWFILGMLARQFISLIAWIVWDSDDKTVICSTGIWYLIAITVANIFRKILTWYVKIFYGYYIIKYDKKDWQCYSILCPKYKAKKTFKIIYPEQTEIKDLPLKGVKQKSLQGTASISDIKIAHQQIKRLDLTEYGQE